MGLLALASCVSLWFSLPAVFVAGGLSLALAWTLFQQRQWNLVPAYAIWNLFLVDSFVGLQLA